MKIVDEMMTTEELAKYFNKNPRWVAKAVPRLRIPHYKLGKQYRFKMQEVEEWLKKQ